MTFGNQRIVFIGEILADAEPYFIVNTDKAKNIKITATTNGDVVAMRKFLIGIAEYQFEEHKKATEAYEEQAQATVDIAE